MFTILISIQDYLFRKLDCLLKVYDMLMLW